MMHSLVYGLRIPKKISGIYIMSHSAVFYIRMSQLAYSVENHIQADISLSTTYLRRLVFIPANVFCNIFYSRNVLLIKWIRLCKCSLGLKQALFSHTITSLSKYALDRYVSVLTVMIV